MPDATQTFEVPLTTGQRGLWFAQLIDPANPRYRVAEQTRITGAVDVERFRRALVRTVADAEVLRGRVVEAGSTGEPALVIDGPPAEPPFTCLDLSADANPAAAAEEWQRERLDVPLDITRPSAFEFALLRLSDTEYVWFQQYHHLLLDGVGEFLVQHRCAEIYTALTDGRPVPPADFPPLRTLVDAEAEYRASALHERDREFWATRLADAPEPVTLGTDIPHVPRAQRRAVVSWSPERVAALRAAATELGAAWPVLPVAALALGLDRRRGDRQVVLGLPVAARGGTLDKVPGMVSNVLPLRLDMRSATTVGDLVRSVSADLRATTRHQRHRQEDLRHELGLLGGTRRLYGPQVNLALGRIVLDFAGHPGISRNVSTVPTDDLSLGLDRRPDDGGLDLVYDVHADVFTEEEFAALRARLDAIVDVFIGAAHDLPLATIDTTTPAERRHLLHEVNDTAHDVPATTLPALFEQQVRATPHAPAVVFGGTSLTYSEFNEKANRLAHLLLTNGIRRGDRVAVAIPRSVDMVTALYAAHKCGAAYVPIDPDLPAERIAFVVADARPALLLTTAALAAVLPPTPGTPRLPVDAVAGLTDRPAHDPTDADRGSALSGPDTAYVIYTSGSTGRPKGVAVPHRAIVNRLLWMREAYAVDHTDRILQKTPAGFDVSVWEIFLPLLAGATLVVAEPGAHTDPAALGKLISTERISTAHFVPSMLQTFLAEVDPADCASLRRVICSGEALSGRTSRRFLATMGAELHNLYGPTEAAVDVTARRCTPDESHVDVPIGRPVWNTRVLVLDAALRPAPVGVAGELYLAGTQLADGYFGRPGLSAERFVADPWGPPGTRMYRTGDLGRWSTGGELEFLGRVDHQVKIRGFRIEPGEIEATLAASPDVDQVTVIARDDAPGEPGDHRLVAYLVPAPGAEPGADALRELVAATLPGYMVPAAFVVLDQLPTTANGKLDRRALPAPDYGAGSAGRAARTVGEELLCGLFAEVLGVGEVTVDDDFFALGGHSLLASRLVGRVRSVLGAEITVRDVFEAPTPLRLLDRTGSASRRPPLVRATDDTPAPLSAGQRQQWVLHRVEGPSSTYNMGLVMRITGALDHAALRAALHDVTSRHEPLRTLFPDDDTGAPRQVVLAADTARPELTVVRVAEAELPGALRAAGRHTFDLATELPIRATCFVVGTEHVLLVLMHHIAGDGHSMGPLTRDLSLAYTARASGRTPDRAPLPVRYSDYCRWQRAVLGDEEDPGSLAARQFEHWRAALAGLPEEIALPTDRPRPSRPTNRGSTAAIEVDADTHGGLAALARNRGATLFMVVQAALATVLTKLGGGYDLPIGSVVAGRADEALDELVGYFVNTVVLRTDTSGDPTFVELLGRVRETDLAAYANQDLPFERIVERLRPERSTSHNPLFQVMLVLQDDSAQLELPGATALQLPAEREFTKVDLVLEVRERRDADGTPDGLTGHLEFSTDLFDRATAERMTDRLVRVLAAAVADPDRPIGAIDVLDPAERTRLLVEWNDTARDIPVRTLSRIFEDTVAATPDATAIVAGRSLLSYAELDARASRMARSLIARGAGPERLVAVLLPRSVDLVVTELAISKAGAGFVPLDPAFPADRIAHILHDARPLLVMTSADAAALPEPGCPVLLVDDVRAETAAEVVGAGTDGVTDADHRCPVSPANTAYVIYTSGSTGVPKGVVVTHRGLAGFTGFLTDRFAATADSRVLQFASPSFDTSVLELCLAFGSGGALVVSSEAPLIGSTLADVLLANRVTHALIPPAAAATLPDRELPDLHTLAVGGDACPADLVTRFAPGRRMLNGYGPTEYTIAATFSHPLRPGGIPSMGGPLWNTRVFVLDTALSPVPSGVSGELYLAGDGLARGYLGHPELTAQRFVANPFDGPGTRMYRTGDLVRWTAGGELDFLGRTDDQVKIRGFRVELGEVESVLGAHPAVRQCVVVVREDPPGTRRLVGYAVPGGPAGPGGGVDSDALRAHAASFLPEYMVPAAIVVLDALPMTANGMKVDRKALPAPEFGGHTTGTPPRSDTEALLCGLFAEVLRLTAVGTHDSFFELGGDSIMSIQLVTRARAAGLLLTPKDVFTHRTVAALAAAAVPLGPDGTGDIEGSEADGAGPVRLTPIMHWLREHGNPVDDFAQSMLLTTPAGLTEDELHTVVQAVLDRHDALRMTLVRRRTWRTTIAERGSVTADACVRRVDVAGCSPDGLLATLRAEHDRAHGELAPDAGAMVRLVWFDPGPGRSGRLLLVLHHLVVDGVSWRIIGADLAAGRQAVADGRTPRAEPVPTSYRSWARAVADSAHDPALLSELDDWLAVLDEPDSPLGARPVDPATDTAAELRQVSLTLPVPMTTALLTTVPAAFLARPDEMLLTALALAVTRWRSSRGDASRVLLVDLEGHGRDQLDEWDVSRTVGWFTTMHPARLDLSDVDVDAVYATGATEQAAAAVRRVKQQLRTLPPGAGYGRLRYLNPETAAEFSGLATPQLAFNYLGRLAAPTGSDDWALAAEQAELGGGTGAHAPVRHALQINAISIENADGPELSATVSWPADLFAERDVVELAELWRQALEVLRDAAGTASGHTPSDFPLVALDQAEVDTLLAAVPDLVDVLPLSPLAGSFFFHSAYHERGADPYTPQVILDLAGPLDIDRLATSARLVLDRYPNLRAGVTDRGLRGPVQFVPGDAEVPFRVIDLSTMDDASAGTETRDVLLADRQAGFVLHEPPLVRFTLLVHRDQRHRLVLTNHHVLLDGWSVPLLLRELFDCYAAGADVTVLPPAARYRDYLAWLVQQDRPATADVWRRALEGLDGPTLLAGPVRSASPELRRPDCLTVRLTGLTELAHAWGVTTNTVLQGLWALVLATRTGRDDVVFGATVSGRPPELPGVESMVGLLINTVPVRVRTAEARSFRDLLTRIQAGQADLLGHHHLDLAGIQRAAGTGELFDTLVVFENYPLDQDTMRLPGTGLRLTGVDSEESGHYPLTVVGVPGDELQVRLHFRDELIARREAAAIAEHLCTLAGRLVEDPDTILSTAGLLPDAERSALLVAGRGPWRVVPGVSIPERFARQVAAVPDAVALVSDGCEVTYRELDRRANRLAHRLLALGVRGEDRVALLQRRSVDLVVSTLAVLKAGAVYVPLDPRSPADRLARMTAAAGAAVLLADTEFSGVAYDGTVVVIGSEELPGTDTDPGVMVHPDQLAYVMFTSGSTGEPKGVAVTHQDVLNFASDTLWKGPNHERMLQNVAHWFDPSVYELWVSLLFGRRLVIAPHSELDVTELARTIQDNGVTALALPAAVFRLVADEHPECFAGVRELMVGGETMPTTAARRVLAANPGLILHNGYGPTETTVMPTAHTMRHADDVPASVPIGRAMDNRCVYVLDHRLQLVPRGVTGELYVSGEGIARGYLNQPGLTAQRFVADPFSPGARMYRTGDLVRWNADGHLTFLGRVDEQVKVRGFRIELGEIETALAAHPAIGQATAVVHEVTPDDKRIVAYYVPAPGKKTGKDELRADISAALPDYMVPSAFVALDALPLTANGKLDRKTLPAPEFGTQETRTAPRTDTETTLCALFAEVLGMAPEQVGIHNGFFDLGGHSLLATRLVSRIRSVLGVEVSVRAVFEAPTVAEFAAVLAGAAAGRPALQPMPRGELVPASFGQRRLWFLNTMDPDTSPYRIPAALRLTGDLDTTALRTALTDVITRHEILRTVYRAIDGEPHQTVLTHSPTGLWHEPVTTTEDELPTHLATEFNRPFDLETEPPLRGHLFRLGRNEHVLMLVLHHIAGDGASIAPLVRDLTHAYTTRHHHNTAPTWEPLPVQYADYALWQRQWLGDENDPTSTITKQLTYWKTTLAGLPEGLELPTDHPRPALTNYQGESIPLEVPAGVHRKLTALATHQRASMFMVTHAALAALLNRIGAGTDIPIGTPIAGRVDETLDNLVGFFVNTLVLRTDVSGNPTFLELLNRVRHTDLNAYTNQDLPFERLVEILNPTRTLSRHPLFQVMLSFQSKSWGTVEMDGLAVEHVAIAADGEKFDLSVELAEHFGPDGEPGGMAGKVHYRTDLFDRDTVRRLVATFGRLLTQVADTPQQPIGTAELLDDAERSALLVAGRGPRRVVPGVSIPERFAKQVTAVPDAVALVSDGCEVTYRELDRRANRLAHRLLALGVRSEDRVALLQRRSVDLVVSTLAVLKVGAVYVPLDRRSPADRLTRMLTACGTAILLTDTDTDVSDVEYDATVVAVGSEELPEIDTDPGVVVHPDQLAYVTFTSGSTGEPKGVAVTHRDVLNLASDTLWKGTNHERMLQNVAHWFDPSVYELWVSLLFGRQLVIAPDGELDIAGLARTIQDNGITALTLPSAVFRLIAEEHPECFAGVRELMAGGEAMATAAARRVLTVNPALVLRNGYGPTETTVMPTAHTMRHADEVPASIPIGRPMDNRCVYVLDHRLRLVPHGVTGELYVSGEGIARGYLNQPGLTVSRFVADPFGTPGARMYRTGDLVRWNTDGDLAFLGRVDEQVKVRGFRIELGEIETALAAHPAIGQATAVVHEVTPDDKRIVAYYVPAPGEFVDEDELRADASAALPDYMVPSAFVALDALPLTANGKLDRKTLPAPEFGTQETRTAPRTDTETTLCALFAEVLGMAPEQVGIHNGFFDLGGHSLLATRLVSRIRTTIGIEVSVRTVFEAPTVAEFAAALTGAAAGRPALQPMPRGELVPASFGQRRLWFLNTMDPDTSPYRIPAALRLTGDLDTTALRTALTDVITRHEILRTVYRAIDGEPHQTVLTHSPTGLWHEPVTTTEDELPTHLATEFNRPFDLETEPPLRGHLFRLGRNEHVLMLVLHHIAGDGASIAPLVRDLTHAYTTRHHHNTAPTWEPLPVQYADYALWQRQWLGDENDPTSTITKQLTYWKTTLAGLPEGLELPTDHPRPALTNYQGESIPLEVPAGVHRKLTALATHQRASMFMVTHAALAALLNRIGAGTDIPIGTPIAGRVDETLDNLVGFFVNTLVLRTDVSGNPTFLELLNRVRHTDLNAYTNQDLPFERLVEILNPTRTLSRHPLFQVMLTFQSDQSTAFTVPGLDVTQLPVTDGGGAKFDLSVDLAEHFGPDGEPDGMTGAIRYRTDLFERDTVRRLAATFGRLLTQVADTPQQPIGTAELLDDATRQRLLVDWNDTAAEVATATLPELFTAQARRTPDSVAVRHGRTSMSYAELDSATDRLAHVLVGQGIGPERTAAVALPRSVGQVVALLAVLKARGAYVPIDPDHPRERLRYVLADARVSLLLTTPEQAGGLPEGDAPILLVDRDTGVAQSPVAGVVALPAPSPYDPAYVIYTSGSTGRPKGVVVEHRSLSDYLAFAGTRYPGMRDMALVTTTASFDLTVTGMFVPLTVGGAVHLAALDEDADTLAALRERSCALTKVTPSHLPMLAELPDEFSPRSELLIGGEALHGEAMHAWRAAHPDASVVNCYGPTELTVNCTDHLIAPGTPLPDGPVPIGRPMANTTVHVLDQRLRQVDIGIAGELYVSGAGLARGYLNRPELTASRFVASPFSPGARMYRTGDLVRWTPEGDLVFLGRADEQVKLRGFRIELGEIESVLARRPGVRRAVAMVRTDRAGDQRLVAYLVPDPGTSPDPVALRDALSAVLPDYQVPSAFVVLDELPLTPNRKVDRAALPAPADRQRTGTAPRDDVERLLCELFGEVLGVTDVSVDDGFFDLGGHSLLATRLIGRVRDSLGVRLGIRALFEAPTVAELARRIGAEAGGTSGGNSFEVLVALREQGHGTPVFCIHPASGFARSYTGLLRHIDADIPVYGLQAQGMDGTSLPRSVAEVAADYVGRVRKVQPHGPYRLVGYSFGGIIVHEMAAQLQESGEAVELLAVLDTAPRTGAEPVPDQEDMHDALFRAMLGAGGYDLAGLSDQRLDADRVACLLAEHGGIFGDLDADQLRLLCAVMVNNSRMAGTHVPRRYRGDVHLFVATQGNRLDPATWDPYVDGALIEHPVDTDHAGMTRPHSLDVVGRVLAQALTDPVTRPVTDERNESNGGEAR